MCLDKNSFDHLLISFVFYTHNFLEKQAENSVQQFVDIKKSRNI